MSCSTATAASPAPISDLTPQFGADRPQHLSSVRVKIGETGTGTSNFVSMSRASRPDLRSSRRSRRRQAVLACGGLSYLAAVFAGLFALASLFVPTDHAAVWALVVAGGVALFGAVLAALDAALAPRGNSATSLSPRAA